ncbi:MAG TPA: hypothetical protein VK053_01985 [Jiangellaceae bacterium]|nr:hypothetical protein [Jiangellaceae bacterium]
MVFHEHALLERLTVRQNVAYVSGNLEVDESPYLARADRQLAHLGLDEVADLYLHEVSAGTRPAQLNSS